MARRPYPDFSVRADPSGGMLCVRATPPEQRIVDTLTLQSQLALQAGRFVLRMRGDRDPYMQGAAGWAYQTGPDHYENLVCWLCRGDAP